MGFLLGIGLFVFLLGLDIIFMFLVKKSKHKQSMMIFMGFFGIGMMMCLVYVVSIIYFFINPPTFDFALGLLISVIASTTFKVVYAVLSLK